jgi:hypothetical protein
MTLVASGVFPVTQSGSVVNHASGTYTGDGTQGAIQVNIGFTPMYVKVINNTDTISYEWMTGMAATDTIKIAANGAATLNTSSCIVTNAVIATATEMAVGAPGSSSADEGTQGTTTVSLWSPNKAVTPLTFTAGSSGADMNVNAKVYTWIAIG